MQRHNLSLTQLDECCVTQVYQNFIHLAWLSSIWMSCPGL